MSLRDEVDALRKRVEALEASLEHLKPPTEGVSEGVSSAFTPEMAKAAQEAADKYIAQRKHERLEDMSLEEIDQMAD